MPARMIRETLLESDRFLGLPDNTARMCFVTVLLKADDRGNLEASPGQLVRIWRDFGVDSNAKAASIAQFLADVDLIRMYEVDGKHYIHVPRFGQRLRHLKKAACQPSPWCEVQEKHKDDQKNDGRTTVERQSDDGRTTAEEKRSEEKEPAPQAVRDAIWSDGLQIVKNTGVTESNARSFIGTLCAQWDDAHVLDALRAAVGKVEPKAYARKFLASRPKKGQAEQKRMVI